MRFPKVKVTISQEQLDMVKTLLRHYPRVAASIASRLTEILRQFAIGRSPIGIRPPRHGVRLKDSWSEVKKIGVRYTFYAGVPHAQVLEEGLYPNVGPRTVGIGGKVYSKQAPGGIISPMMQSKQSPLGPNLTLKAAAKQIEAEIDSILQKEVR